MGAEGFPVWVVFNRPRDYPDKYVLRKQTVWRDGAISKDEKAYTADTLADVRKHLPPGLYWMPRHPNDDPAIEETWI